MDGSAYLNNCLWGLYSDALLGDRLDEAEAAWLLIDGFSRMKEPAVFHLLRNLGPHL